MNICLFTGTFKQRPNLKNKTAYGTLKTDKMFLTVVAFGDVADQVAKMNTTDLVMVEGKLEQHKYNEKWSLQLVINSIKVISPSVDATPLDEPLGSDLDTLDDQLEEEVKSGNLDGIDIPDDSLPF